MVNTKRMVWSLIYTLIVGLSPLVGQSTPSHNEQLPTLHWVVRLGAEIGTVSFKDNFVSMSCNSRYTKCIKIAWGEKDVFKKMDCDKGTVILKIEGNQWKKYNNEMSFPKEQDPMDSADKNNTINLNSNYKSLLPINSKIKSIISHGLLSFVVFSLPDELNSDFYYNIFGATIINKQKQELKLERIFAIAENSWHCGIIHNKDYVYVLTGSPGGSGYSTQVDIFTFK